MRLILASICVLLLLTTTVLAVAVVRLEKKRLANAVGLCHESGVNYASDPQARIRREKCLAKAPTKRGGVTLLLAGIGVF